MEPIVPAAADTKSAVDLLCPAANRDAFSRAMGGRQVIGFSSNDEGSALVQNIIDDAPGQGTAAALLGAMESCVGATWSNAGALGVDQSLALVPADQLGEASKAFKQVTSKSGRVGAENLFVVGKSGNTAVVLSVSSLGASADGKTIDLAPIIAAANKRLASAAPS